MEMGTMNGQAGNYGQPASRDPNAILTECRDIDRGIDTIEQNLQRLRALQQRAIDDPDASQNTQTNRELDALTSETMTLYRNFTKRLQAIKSQKASGDPRNAPQVGRVDRKLKNAINQYQQAESEYRRNVAQQMERQYRIVRPDASDSEVREAVEDTSNNQVFSQAVSLSAAKIQTLLIRRHSSSKGTDVARHNLLFELFRVAMRLSRRLKDKWKSLHSCSHKWMNMLCNKSNR